MYRQLAICFALDVAALVLFRLLLGRRLERPALCLAAVAYAAVVIYLTLLRGKRATGIRGFKFKLPLPFWKALVTHHYGRTTNRSVLNVLLFVPLGYLVPRLRQLTSLRGAHARGAYPAIGLWATATTGLLASLAIECAQYALGRGVFELDDLVKNTLGAAVGWLAYAAIERIARSGSLTRTTHPSGE